MVDEELSYLLSYSSLILPLTTSDMLLYVRSFISNKISSY